MASTEATTSIADTPGKGDPNFRPERLLCEQVADRVDDGCHRLVFGESAYRARHVAVGTNAELMNGRKMSG